MTDGFALRRIAKGAGLRSIAGSFLPGMLESYALGFPAACAVLGRIAGGALPLVAVGLARCVAASFAGGSSGAGGGRPIVAESAAVGFATHRAGFGRVAVCVDPRVIKGRKNCAAMVNSVLTLRICEDGKTVYARIRLYAAIFCTSGCYRLVF